MTRIALFGCGRFGKEILSLMPEYQTSCAVILTKNGCPEKSSTPCIITELEDLDPETIDVCIDVALPDGLEKRAEWAITHHKPLIIGTTGWDPTKSPILSFASQHNSSLVWSFNYSLGVWLFRKIVQNAAHYAQNLPEFNFGLFEAHHKGKKDAPSGTLLSIEKDIEKGLQRDLQFVTSAAGEIHAQNASSNMTVDVATLRVGHVPGSHMVWIDGPEEVIHITHTSRTRKTFARGIFTALSLLQKNPGVWEFSQLLEQYNK